jgi:hypothetical protein
MALMDLQGLEYTEEEHGGGGSRLSVTGCNGISGLSVTLCI